MPNGSSHPLLQRQLRRLGLSAEQPPADAAAWAELLRRVGRAYAEAEQDRYLLERSQDLSSREMAELHTELRASQARLASLLSLSSDWVWEQDATGRLTWVSLHGSDDHGELTGALVGCRPMIELPPIDDGDRQQYSACTAMHEPFRNVGCVVTLPSGEACYVRISGQPVFEAGEFRGYRGVGTDITAATVAEQKVLHLARFDSLTGVANRNLFMLRLEHKIEQARGRQGAQPALLFIDLDRFKMVNDTLGHEAGDDLLKEMARRLCELVRGDDVVARLGGDEFVVLIDGCIDPAVLSKLASRMISRIGESLMLAGRTVQISASIGIAVYPADGSDASALLKSADTAMYQAKARGKNGFCFFTSELSVAAARHFMLEGELRAAIDGEELRLHYQPKFDVNTGALVGMEALVRWLHPQRGLLSPAEFIELAEECGLIVALGRWVIREACRQIRAWRESGLQPPRCAINVSPRQLASTSLVPDLQEALAEWALEGGALEIEITEGALMADPERAHDSLTQLRALGVRVAIDDFGTGYASLAYLKRFPATSVKIDREFVAGLPGNQGDAAIVNAVVTLAHSLQMQVVAEGVESSRQLDFLRLANCDQAQGYLLGRPAPPADLAERMAGLQRPTLAAA